VVNITDVGHLVSDADTGEDKMEKASRNTGKTARELAHIYTKAFKDDLQNLNIQEPTIWCKATEHISEQIDTIRCIEKKGFTYRTSDGIYFDTSKQKNYGYLGRIDIKGIKAGTRIDMGEKRNPTDFALWKFSPKDEKRQMEWDSPWGIGFPGWHIECSAMSAKYLGQFFDIHCGGEDHISIHHPNEIAQTEACYGTKLANFWMHGYFLLLDEAKMAKSAGKFIHMNLLSDNGYDPLAYRYLCLTGHYRTNLKFTWASMDSATTALNRLRKVFFDVKEMGSINQNFSDQFVAHINNDLNMPRALGVVWELVKNAIPSPDKKATLMHFDKVLGLRLSDWHPQEQNIPAEIKILVEQRCKARAEKRYEEADKLRFQINAAGYEIEDTPKGSKVKIKQ
jgi:cysteinyl-tRNA synthetase